MPVLAFAELVKWKNDNLSLSISLLAANGTDSKTYKGERSPCDPSRVLHVRKVPIEVSEAEVVSLGVPFGKVTNLLMLKGKNQVGAPLTCEHISVLSFRSISILQLWNLPFEILKPHLMLSRWFGSGISGLNGVNKIRETSIHIPTVKPLCGSSRCY